MEIGFLVWLDFQGFFYPSRLTIGDEDEDEDSSCSSVDSKQRLSPPTQVQSLSEETSSADGRISKVESPTTFGSDSDLEIVKNRESKTSPISRKKILAAVGVGNNHSMKETNSRAHLLPSSSSSNSSLAVNDIKEDKIKQSDHVGKQKDHDGGTHDQDYVKSYGQVPRLISGQQVLDEEDGEDDSLSILTEK